jgi:hypothetical protein
VGYYQIIPAPVDPDGRLRNYTLNSELGRLTVTQAPLTVRADNKSRRVGKANPTLTGTILGIQNGDNITATYSTTADYLSLPGGYPIHPTLHDPGQRLNNYRVTIRDGTMTVKVVQQDPLISLAVVDVTADDHTRPYGMPNPELTGSITGLQAGNPVTATYTTVATQQSPPGIYTITPHINDPNNLLNLYVVVTHDGTLIVTPSKNVKLTILPGVSSRRIIGEGDALAVYTIQASQDLVSWKELGTATADTAGRFEFDDVSEPSLAARFFRVRLP